MGLGGSRWKRVGDGAWEKVAGGSEWDMEGVGGSRWEQVGADGRGWKRSKALGEGWEKA